MDEAKAERARREAKEAAERDRAERAARRAAERAARGEDPAEEDGDDDEDAVAAPTRKRRAAGKPAGQVSRDSAGVLHYAGDVHVYSNQRPGGNHFDLVFQMYDADGAVRPFTNCDPTGKFAEGKDQPLLRSKVAVARYLERAGVDASNVEKQDNAIREAKERAEAAYR